MALDYEEEVKKEEAERGEKAAAWDEREAVEAVQAVEMGGDILGGEELFMAPEILFNPELMGRDMRGLSNLTYVYLNTGPVKTGFTKVLVVVLGGGNCQSGLRACNIESTYKGLRSLLIISSPLCAITSCR